MNLETREDHKKCFESVRDWAAEAFKSARSHDEQLTPAIIAFKDEEEEGKQVAEIYVIATLSNEMHKNALSELMVEIVDKGAKAIAFISETWVVRCDKEAYKEMSVAPSEHPNRVEMLYVSYSFVGGEWGAMAEIKDKELDPWEVSYPERGDIEGRFAQVWERARARHAIWN